MSSFPASAAPSKQPPTDLPPPTGQTPTSYHDAFKTRGAHTKFADPCEQARAESMKCLDKNSYDRGKCTVVSSSFEWCGESWLRDERRAGGGGSACEVERGDGSGISQTEWGLTIFCVLYYPISVLPSCKFSPPLSAIYAHLQEKVNKPTDRVILFLILLQNHFSIEIVKHHGWVHTDNPTCPNDSTHLDTLVTLS